MTIKKEIYIITAVVALLVIGAFVFFYKKEVPVDKVNPINLQSDKENEAQTDADTNTKVTYSYELVLESLDGPTVTFDGSIIQTENETGKKVVLVKSIKQAYPPLQKMNNLTLQKLIFPKTGGKLYFTQIYMDTDAGLSNIISFDIASRKFSELAIGKYYTSFVTEIAPNDRPFIISTRNPANYEDDKNLYVLDLEKDTVTKVLTLPGTQSFNLCYQNNCFGGYMADIAWLDNNSFEVGIYNTNESAPHPELGEASKLIEKRKFTVN